MDNILETIQLIVTTYGFRLVGAVAFFLIGRWVAKWLTGLAQRSIQRAKIDATLQQFVVSLVNTLLLIFIILATLNILGVQTTSFVAFLGAAGLAIGLALDGALSNFAAGAMVLVFRPYNVGDLIEANGEFGRVEQIQLFNTILVTANNKTIIIPNSQATGSNITNYSTKGAVRLQLIYGIDYGDDVRQAKEVLMRLMKEHPHVLDQPAPSVILKEFGDNSVNLEARPYVKTAHYFSVPGDLNEAVKYAFDDAGISFPFPQRDVHLYQQS